MKTPTKTPAEEAARILSDLTPFDVAYAIAPERGEFRGFAALHDLFDANDLLPQGLDVSAPEHLSAIVYEVTRLLCAIPTAPEPVKYLTDGAADYIDSERSCTVSFGEWEMTLRPSEFENFEDATGELLEEDELTAPQFAQLLHHAFSSEWIATPAAPVKSDRETALENALRRVLHIAVWDEDFDAADRAEFDAATAEAGALLAGTMPPTAIPLPALAMECAGYVNDDARWTSVRAILRAAYNTIPGFTPEQAADFARLAGLPEHFKSERKNVFPYSE